MAWRKINTKMSAKEFYLRSFTWGLPVNIGGAFISSVLLAAGYSPVRYGRCIRFSVGRGWGGGSLGVFLFTCRDASERLKMHEHGHSLQNCYYGPLMPLLVNVPSSLRFWYRKAVQKLWPEHKLPPYDGIWFEAEASEIGKEYIKNMESEQKNNRENEREDLAGTTETAAYRDLPKEEPADYPVLRTASRILLGALTAVLAAEAFSFRKNRK